MENVPWHEEVIEFTRKLASYIPQYEVKLYALFTLFVILNLFNSLTADIM